MFDDRVQPRMRLTMIIRPLKEFCTTESDEMLDAVAYCNCMKLFMLLRKRVDPNNKLEGESPLWRAVSERDRCEGEPFADMVEMLLRGRADPNLRCFSGCSVLLRTIRAPMEVP